MQCPVCQSLSRDRTAPYRGPWQEEVSLHRCGDCGTWFIDKPDGYEAHFETVRYNMPEYEERHFKRRYDFFSYIVDNIVKRYDLQEWQEVGPGHGHLLSRLREMGYGVCGIEVSEVASERLRKKGFQVYRDIAEADTGGRCGVILLDSFYYLQKPLEFLGSLGVNHRVVIMRSINRALPLDIYTFLFPGRVVPKSLFGDALFNPSVKGITRAFEAGGFVVSIRPEPARMKTKNMKLKKKFYYHLTALLSRVSGHVYTPGFILVAERKDRHPG